MQGSSSRLQAASGAETQEAEPSLGVGVACGFLAKGWWCCAGWEEVLCVQHGDEGGDKDQAGGIRVGVRLLD